MTMKSRLYLPTIINHIIETGYCKVLARKNVYKKKQETRVGMGGVGGGSNPQLGRGSDRGALTF